MTIGAEYLTYLYSDSCRRPEGRLAAASITTHFPWSSAAGASPKNDSDAEGVKGVLPLGCLPL